MKGVTIPFASVVDLKRLTLSSRCLMVACKVSISCAEEIILPFSSTGCYSSSGRSGSRREPGSNAEVRSMAWAAEPPEAAARLALTVVPFLARLLLVAASVVEDVCILVVV